MDFQIDFGNVAAPAPPDDRGGPLFAAAPGVLLPLGGDEVVFRLRRDGTHHVMARQVFEALARCAAFRGLDRHAAEVAATLPGLAGRVPAVRAVLDQLVARGLLLSADDWLAALRGPGPRQPAPGVLALHGAGGAPAESVLAALAAAPEPPTRVLVCGAHGLPAAALDGLRARGIVPLAIDVARRRGLIERLARAVPSAAAALPALFGDATAGWRNLATLLAAGARLTWFDGRCRLPLHRAARFRPGLDLAAAAAVPARFHARADEALAEGTPLDHDPLATLAAGCGESIGRLVAPTGPWALSRADLHGIEPAALTHLTPQGRVAAVVAGQRGAAREPGREWLFLLDRGSRERFWSDRDLYLRTLDQPCVWHGPEQARLLHRTLEAPQAFDATALLPPVPGDAVGDDAFWGLLLHAVRPHDVVLHAPFALAADPVPAPRGAGGWALETPGLGALLTDLLAPRVAELRAADPASRLSAVAAHLRDLAGAPHGVLAELLSEYLGFCRADLVARLQAAFAAATDAPVHWQADVRALVESNGRALTAAGAPRLAGWPDLDETGCAARFAQDVAALAGAVEAWPALWAYARDSGALLLDA
jgi:hypothetical protein